ncbi:MgtC/SapB family protein [Silicimonas algicola]|uniref:Protein MgtC n=1 Tax=Silicimonas algicola TaxID=1826607 RepID=A0A316G3V6_9RHOB|nr:MgtC/SapB family protein [Silicimonas algicola]AZQ68648.1 MgtC/SapB family protein [Silicimonas algicola]PWK55621.1 putative Mg2+ transporter-C (MgtC) family protein [Silicimonas algicola]
MTLDSLVFALRDTDVMLPLLCSVVSGALIGAEREFLGKAAGLRTHTLVCFASALVTLLGLRMAEWTAIFPEGTQIVSDMARMPHAILTGIGFLGAGVIFRSRLTVQGLTTAASLWLTASLGIVYGAGLLELAIIGTAIALLVLILLRILPDIAPPQPVIRLEIAVNADSSFDGAQLVASLAANRLRAGSPSIKQDRASGLRRYTILAFSHDVGIDCEALAREMQDNPVVQELSITPLSNEDS